MFIKEIAQVARARGYKVGHIINPLIENFFPALLFYRNEDDPESYNYERIIRRIRGTSKASLLFISTYASLLGIMLDDNQIIAGVLAGKLMGEVDDVYDTRSKSEALRLAGVTNRILEDAKQGLFPPMDMEDYLKKHYSPGKTTTEFEYNMDMLIIYTLCAMIHKIPLRRRQRVCECLLRIQRAEIESLIQQDSGVDCETLKQVMYDKGGYTALLGGYLVDDELHSITDGLFSLTQIPPTELTPDVLRVQFLYELGGLIQLVDDYVDREEDEELGLKTWIKDCVTDRKAELNNTKKRVSYLFDLAFRGKIPFLRYHIFKKILTL